MKSLPIIDTRIRPRTEDMRRLSQREFYRAAAEYPEQPGVDYERPRVRGDCEPGGRLHYRPCPFVSCQYNLYVDVSEHNGSIKYNHPDREAGEIDPSCALDVASRGEHTLEEVGDYLNLTRERVRQIEWRALADIADLLVDHLDDPDEATIDRAALLRGT